MKDKRWQRKMKMGFKPIYELITSNKDNLHIKFNKVL